MPKFLTPVALLVLSVKEDIFSYGMSWEEPEEVPGYAYSVVAEGAHGERYTHFKAFRMNHSCYQKGCTEHPEDICPAHEAEEFKSEAACKAAAQRLLVRIQAAQKAGTWAGPVGSEHWSETEPCYGSEAYEAGGWEAHNAEMEAREEGFTLESGEPRPIPGFVGRK